MKELPQPLGYQQQRASCWITSVMNGMISLLTTASQIPNEVARVIYAISSKEGTDLKETEKVANFINSYGIKIKCTVLKGAQVTPSEVRKVLLDSKGVVVADIDAGEHSVLITGYLDGQYRIFDPDWKTIKKGRRGEIRDAEFPKGALDLPKGALEYNLKVDEEELFAGKIRQNSIRMGAVSKRCLFTMEKLK